MSFSEAFVEELGKLAKRRKGPSPLGSLLRHALFGAGLGGMATAASAPFFYTSLRVGKGLTPKAALIQTLLRVGERSAYGLPLGAAGGWMGWNIFKDRKRKR